MQTKQKVYNSLMTHKKKKKIIEITPCCSSIMSQLLANPFFALRIIIKQIPFEVSFVAINCRTCLKIKSFLTIQMAQHTIIITSMKKLTQLGAKVQHCLKRIIRCGDVKMDYLPTLLSKITLQKQMFQTFFHIISTQNTVALQQASCTYRFFKRDKKKDFMFMLDRRFPKPGEVGVCTAVPLRCL